MRPRRNDWSKPYEASMQFVKCITGITEHGEYTPYGVEKLWRRVVGSVLADFGLPRKARTFLWNELAVGNWNHLHMTELEKAYKAVDWLDLLSDEVFYCSDRWTMDRLMRCHWIYRQYMDAAKEET